MKLEAFEVGSAETSKPLDEIMTELLDLVAQRNPDFLPQMADSFAPPSKDIQKRNLKCHAQEFSVTFLKHVFSDRNLRRVILPQGSAN